jgi:Tfp pilus assembly protein PilF
VIDLQPDNAAAWSNRGTVRLQNQQWAAAYEDLVQAVSLEQQQTGTASAVVVNNLGNVEGALGRWADAMQHYQQAAEGPELGSIAGANYALAAWETGQDDLAIKAARSLLRRYIGTTPYP